jgi:hypothetical protein
MSAIDIESRGSAVVIAGVSLSSLASQESACQSRPFDGPMVCGVIRYATQSATLVMSFEESVYISRTTVSFVAGAPEGQPSRQWNECSSPSRAAPAPGSAIAANAARTTARRLGMKRPAFSGGSFVWVMRPYRDRRWRHSSWLRPPRG